MRMQIGSCAILGHERDPAIQLDSSAFLWSRALCKEAIAFVGYVLAIHHLAETGGKTWEITLKENAQNIIGRPPHSTRCRSQRLPTSE